MSKERELLKLWAEEFALHNKYPNLTGDINELLAQPEPEQEPVAWITEWVQRYRHNDTPIMDRAVSFTKGDAPAVPNPNYIPLYTAPPKREPLSEDKLDVLAEANITDEGIAGYYLGFRDAEKMHGIGGLQRNADVLIGRAIELLAQSKQEPIKHTTLSDKERQELAYEHRLKSMRGG